MEQAQATKRANTLPPWREVTPNEFLRATYKETLTAAKRLIQARRDGECRLRLILREAKNLKHGSQRDPLWPYDYKFGTHHMLRDVDGW